jgi:L-rhamnonate dehydratase
MKITAVETFELRGHGQQGSYGCPYGVLVRIRTDAGIEGYGEADSMPSVVKAIIDAPFLNEIMSGLKALLLGEDPTEPERLWAKMARGTIGYARDGAVLHGMAAIDLALWDIKGKSAGLPVCALLGGAKRMAVRAYATHPLGRTLDETKAAAQHLVRKGFTAVKFGWHPLGFDADLDEAIVRTLRQAIGSDVDLLVDAGLAWDVATTLERLERFAPFRLFWLEEPLAPYGIAAYAELTSSTATTIAAGEMASSKAELTRLLEEAHIGVLQIDVSRVGLTQAMQVAEVAAQLGIPCVNHTYGYDINLAASLHFVAAIDKTSLFEVQLTPNEIRDALVRNRPVIKDGLAYVPQEPGLGVQIDEVALNRFHVPV